MAVGVEVAFGRACAGVRPPQFCGGGRRGGRCSMSWVWGWVGCPSSSSSPVVTGDSGPSSCISNMPRGCDGGVSVASAPVELRDRAGCSGAWPGAASRRGRRRARRPLRGFLPRPSPRPPQLFNAAPDTSIATKSSRSRMVKSTGVASAVAPSRSMCRQAFVRSRQFSVSSSKGGGDSLEQVGEVGVVGGVPATAEQAVGAGLAGSFGRSPESRPVGRRAQFVIDTSKRTCRF